MENLTFHFHIIIYYSCKHFLKIILLFTFKYVDLMKIFKMQKFSTQLTFNKKIKINERDSIDVLSLPSLVLQACSTFTQSLLRFNLTNI